MTIKFEKAEGELSASTIMAQANAIWNYYDSTDDVQELVNYLQTAIDSERAKESGEQVYKAPRYNTYTNYKR